MYQKDMIEHLFRTHGSSRLLFICCFVLSEYFNVQREDSRIVVYDGMDCWVLKRCTTILTWMCWDVDLKRGSNPKGGYPVPSKYFNLQRDDSRILVYDGMECCVLQLTGFLVVVVVWYRTEVDDMTSLFGG